MKKYDSNLENATEEDMKIFHAADGKGEYEKCVEISTKSSLRQMVLPGLMAISVPVIVGFIGGAEMLGGLLAGVTTTGVLMAIFQSNAGGAWDNAKKMFEEGIEIDGEKYFKGSDPHKAAVVGDTVGDPFKDTSGPSLNILIKLMAVVALVIAPSIAVKPVEKTSLSPDKEIIMEMDETVGYFNQDVRNDLEAINSDNQKANLDTIESEQGIMNVAKTEVVITDIKIDKRKS